MSRIRQRAAIWTNPILGVEKFSGCQMFPVYIMHEMLVYFFDKAEAARKLFETRQSVFHRFHVIGHLPSARSFRIDRS